MGKEDRARFFNAILPRKDRDDDLGQDIAGSHKRT